MSKPHSYLYFSHDSNAHRNLKIMELVAEYGWVAYSYFFVIIEIMREADNYKLPYSPSLFKSIALIFASNGDHMESIISSCVKIGLFEHDENYFWSPSLMKRMKHKDSINDKRKAASDIAADKRKANKNNDVSSNGDHMESTRKPCGVQSKVKYSKVKESKVKEKERTCALSLNEDFKFQGIETITPLLEKQFPKIDIAAEVEKAERWCAANPAKARVKKDWQKFLVNWLASPYGEKVLRRVDPPAPPPPLNLYEESARRASERIKAHEAKFKIPEEVQG